MRHLKLLAAALAASTIAGSAFAADLPSRKAPPVVYAPAPVFTWTGLYVGVNLGYTWSNRNTVDLVGFTPGFFPAAAAGVLAGTIPAKRDGVIGGGQIGYNWQFGSFVAGLEADFQGLGAKSNSGVVLGTVVNQAQTRQSYLGTVRGRLGFTVTPTFLVYATGGLAYGDVKTSTAVYNAAIFPAGGVFASSYSTTRLGWTVGAGAEYALSPNWSIKAEYLYYNLGNVNVAATDATLAFPTEALFYRQRVDGHIVRAGVNYKFGWGAPAPVVARY